MWFMRVKESTAVLTALLKLLSALRWVLNLIRFQVISLNRTNVK